MPKIKGKRKVQFGVKIAPELMGRIKTLKSKSKKDSPDVDREIVQSGVETMERKRK